MQRIPFDESEMTPIEVLKGRTCDRTLWNSPISVGENLMLAMNHQDPLFMPNMFDPTGINTRSIPDVVARASVRDGQGPQSYDMENGEKDNFGVIWVKDGVSGGAMEDPTKPHLIEDLSELDKIVFPNPEDWDWAGNAERDKEYLEANAGKVIKCTNFTGFFERLISWMGFENAAVAMIDEDQEDNLHIAFSKLCDIYEKYMDLYKKYYGIQIFEFHDDWGSQATTFFSVETHTEKILPYIKRLVDHAHSLGLIFEMHSCGNIAALVPNMVAAGCDAWMGQEMIDKLPLVKEFGDKITIEVEAPELGQDATDEEIWAEVEKFCDEWIIPGKPVALSIYSNSRQNRSLFYEAMYVCSRKKLCGTK